MERIQTCIQPTTNADLSRRLLVKAMGLVWTFRCSMHSAQLCQPGIESDVSGVVVLKVLSYDSTAEPEDSGAALCHTFAIGRAAHAMLFRLLRRCLHKSKEHIDRYAEDQRLSDSEPPASCGGFTHPLMYLSRPRSNRSIASVKASYLHMTFPRCESRCTSEL